MRKRTRRRAPAASETPSPASDKGKRVRSRRAAGPDGRRKTAAPVEPDHGGTAPAFVPEDRAREMVESSLDAAVSLDPAGCVLEFNPAAECLFGYSRAEAMGRDLTELIIPPELRCANARGLGGLVSGSESRWLGQRVELMARHRDGTQFPIELAMTRLHSCNPPCFTAWLRDISDRRLVETELCKLAAFPRLSPQAILELTPEGSLSYFNDAALELTKLLGESHPGRLLPPDAPALLAACLEQGKSRLLYENVVAGRVLVWTFHPIPALRVVHAYVSDHTEQKRASEQIREQATLLDEAHDAIAIRGLDHRLLYWNRGAERIFGWTASEVIGRSSLELFDDQDRERHFQALRGVFERGEWSGELRCPAKSGVLVELHSRWTLLRDDAGRPKSILVLGTDITQKKQAEAEFLRAQRLESIGALASGIAHDLNNILAPIMMSVELLQENTADVSAARLLETVRASAQRGADMVRQILAFTRGHDTEPMAPPAMTPPGQGQQILLVDDEHAFQEMARSIFVKHGYRVLTANDGTEAVEIFSRHPREIALVMTDMMMPCLDGAATIQALRRIDPGVPILAASGLNENEMPASAGGRTAFLSKPFTTETLLQTVAHLLAAPADDGEGRQP